MDDYYILFRDSRNPVPIVRKEKHWQEDWLAEDDASYVWGYVGKLSDSQAERETLIGKVVDFEYLAGASKGRMGRIFRLRDDIVVSSTSLGL